MPSCAPLFTPGCGGPTGSGTTCSGHELPHPCSPFTHTWTASNRASNPATPSPPSASCPSSGCYLRCPAWNGGEPVTEAGVVPAPVKSSSRDDSDPLVNHFPLISSVPAMGATTVATDSSFTVNGFRSVRDAESDVMYLSVASSLASGGPTDPFPDLHASGAVAGGTGFGAPVDPEPAQTGGTGGIPAETGEAGPYFASSAAMPNTKSLSPGSISSSKAHPSTDFDAENTRSLPPDSSSSTPSDSGPSAPAIPTDSANPVTALPTGVTKVWVEAVGPDDPVAEGVGGFRIWRNGTAGDLAVHYTLGGTAAQGTDYAPLSGTVVITDTNRVATVVPTPLNTDPATALRDVTLTLTQSAGYAAGGAWTATTRLGTPTVSTAPVVAADPSLPPAFAGDGPTGLSSHPVRYSDGLVIYSATDLSSAGFGVPWAYTRSWYNLDGFSAHADNGN